MPDAELYVDWYLMLSSAWSANAVLVACVAGAILGLTLGVVGLAVRSSDSVPYSD